MPPSSLLPPPRPAAQRSAWCKHRAVSASQAERRQLSTSCSWERGGRGQGGCALCSGLAKASGGRSIAPCTMFSLPGPSAASAHRARPAAGPRGREGGAGMQVRTVAPGLADWPAVVRHVVRPRAVLERGLAAEAGLGLLEALAVDGAADPRIPQRVQLAGWRCRGGGLCPRLAAAGAAGRGVHRAQPGAGAGRGRPISTRLG